MLTEDEARRILSALEQWAANAPDEPTMGFLQQASELWTPRELVGQVHDRTPDGVALLEILEHGVRREGLDTVVGNITGEAGEYYPAT